MKRINALLISTLVCASAAFAQEMPADLSAKLQTKAAEVNPGNTSAANSWIKKQRNAWETIQNMSFSGDENDVKAIKDAAEKSFPLDYVKQESYINQQTSSISALPEYKVALGKEGYEKIRADFLKSGKTDFAELLDILNKQSTAKNAIDSMKPQGDEMTFAITKEVIAKKFPGDYASQLEALKKQFEKKEAAPQQQAAAPVAAITTAKVDSQAIAAVQAKPDKPLTISELSKLALNQFNSISFVVEGSKRSTAVAIEIEGKPAVIIPFTSYSPDSKFSILNNLGEEVSFEDKDMFALKDLPLMIIFPKALPENTVLMKRPTEEVYREWVGKQIYLVGYTTNNIQSFPLKVNAIGESVLRLSTRIPANFQEGTILQEPTSQSTFGMLTVSTPDVKETNWKDRSSVNRFFRSLDNAFVQMHCLRLDKIENFEPLDAQRFKEEADKIAKMRSIIEDLSQVFIDTRFEELIKRPVIGNIVTKHRADLMRKQDKSRFSRLCSNYLRDLQSLIKMNMRKLDTSKFYTAHKARAIQYESVLKSMNDLIEKAIRSNNMSEFIPTDAKRAQEK